MGGKRTAVVGMLLVVSITANNCKPDLGEIEGGVNGLWSQTKGTLIKSKK